MTTPVKALLAASGSSLLALVVGCESTSAKFDHAAPTAVQFIVASAADSALLTQVEVVAVGHEGQFQTLGFTDSSGTLEVPVATLARARPSLVLFCRDHFFCGALRVTNREEFLRYREHYVHLAAWAFL